MSSDELRKDKALVDMFINKHQYERSISMYVWMQSAKAMLIIAIFFTALYLYPQDKVLISTAVFFASFHSYNKSRVRYYREDTKDMLLYRITKHIVLWLRTKPIQRKKT